ncbi:MAG: hypothetical protein KIT77_07715 [Caldilinea sp.]|nr:hypothetical protein [Caldilinea sp.]
MRCTKTSTITVSNCVDEQRGAGQSVGAQDDDEDGRNNASLAATHEELAKKSPSVDVAVDAPMSAPGVRFVKGHVQPTRGAAGRRAALVARQPTSRLSATVASAAPCRASPHQQVEQRSRHDGGRGAGLLRGVDEIADDLRVDQLQADAQQNEQRKQQHRAHWGPQVDAEHMTVAGQWQLHRVVS